MLNIRDERCGDSSWRVICISKRLWSLLPYKVTSGKIDKKERQEWAVMVNQDMSLFTIEFKTALASLPHIPRCVNQPNLFNSWGILSILCLYAIYKRASILPNIPGCNNWDCASKGNVLMMIFIPPRKATYPECLQSPVTLSIKMTCDNLEPSACGFSCSISYNHPSS